MVRTKSLLFFGTILISLATTCKCKKDSDTKPTVPPLEDIKGYSYFKTGTYWIYKDSTTGAEDSMYVYADTSYDYYFSGTPLVAAGNYNYSKFACFSYLDSAIYTYKIDMAYYGGNKVPVWRAKQTQTESGQSFLMFGDFTPGTTLYAYTSPGAISCVKFYNSLIFNATNFQNVVHFYDTKNASENRYVIPYGSMNPATDYYIAKNVGVVKIRINDNVFNTIHKTKSLMRYHIIQ
jgi:hypothetical protein